jgi:predicted transcriptional regulator
MEMDKKTEHMTFRLTPELKAQVEALALAHDTSPSSIVFDAVSSRIQTELQHVLRLAAAFGVAQGLPGGLPSGLPGGGGDDA